MSSRLSAGYLPLIVVPAIVSHAVGANAARPAHLPLRPVLNAGLPAPPDGLEHSTPRRTWTTLVRACRARNWELATHLLNLDDVRPSEQRELGAALSHKLCRLLATTNQLEDANAPGAELNDTALGPLSQNKPQNYVVATTLSLPRNKTGELWLRRMIHSGSGTEVWLVTRKTVSMISGWHRLLISGDTDRKTVRVSLPPEIDVSNPRAAADSFYRMTSTGRFDLAAKMLDPESARAHRSAPRLARRLALVIQRVHAGGFARISNDPNGAPERDVPDDEEVIASGTLDGTSVQLRLARYARQEAPPVWLVSAATVSEIDSLYRRLGYGVAGDYLPPLFFRTHFLKIQLWQWIALLLGLLVAVFAGQLLSFVTRKALLRLARFTKWEWDDEVAAASRGPLILVYFSLGILVAGGVAALAEAPQQTLARISKILVVLGVGWFLVRLVDVAGVVLTDFFRKRDDDMGMAMVPVARKFFKPIMVLLVLILALQNAGMNVAGLLAGVGIGGLALAMASKATVENMLGGLTIAFDRPFKVADFIRVGDILGTVEEVGLRSTRVRTLDRTVVTIPNGQMVDSRVENFAKRDRVRLVYTIGVQYDSTLDQVRFIVDEIKRALLRHNKVVQDGFRVRFVGFADSAMEIELYLYIDTTDYNEFTAVREELLLSIGTIVDAAGAEFAFPSRTIYTGKASESDSRKAKAAAQLVKERIEAGELTIPEIPDTLRSRISS